MLLSIDIQGTFDTIPFDAIRDALVEHGAEPEITNWLDYLSRNQDMCTTLGLDTLIFRLEEGTTQGGLN